MLIWEPDAEEQLVSTLINSSPFFLFAPEEFREELRKRLISLYTYRNPRTPDQFKEELKRINEMLTGTDFGENANVHIYNLQTKMKPLNEILADLLDRVSKLEKQDKYSRKQKKINTDVEPVDIGKIIAPELPLVSKLPLKEATESIKDKVFEDIRNSANNRVSAVDEVPIFTDDSKPLAVRIIDYLQHKSPSIITSLEMGDIFNIPSKYITSEICRLKKLSKYAEQAKHIEGIEKYSPGIGKKPSKSFRWVENP